MPIVLPTKHRFSTIEHVVQPVRGGLVGAEEAEVRRPGVGSVDVPHHLPERAGGFVACRSRLRHREREAVDVGQPEVGQQPAAVGVRVRAHPPASSRREVLELGGESAVRVEQGFRVVAPHPRLERLELPFVRPHEGQGHLVRPERALDGQPVHFPGAGPALGRPQHDRRPSRPSGDALRAGLGLDGPDAAITAVQRRGELLVERHRVVALDEVHLVAVSLDRRAHIFIG